MPGTTLTPARDGIQIGSMSVRFMRTLRIPDDGRQHALPPGLGTFPLRRVTDYAERVPAEWVERGGVFLPMHEREAMWLDFGSPHDEPHALKVGVGMVNAVTGKPWSEHLDAAEQDYVVLPEQYWLDGIKTEDDTVRQFVAMPLGGGYTVEGQITGEEQYGGVQLLAFPAKPGAIRPSRLTARYCMDAEVLCCDASLEMGMAAGGRMHQEIYDDPYGIDVWDETACARVCVHVCNAQQWQAITGEIAPALPPNAEEYDGPWFDVAPAGVPVVPGAEILGGVKSVGAMDAAKTAPGGENVVVYQPTS